MGMPEKGVINNVVWLEEYLQSKTAKQVSNNVPSSEDTFTFDASKLIRFIVEFVRENETTLTDDDIIKSLQMTFEKFNSHFSSFSINLLS